MPYSPSRRPATARAPPSTTHESLDETGRVFVIDELPAVEAHERVAGDAVAPAVERSLKTGARYRVVKVFYQPAELSRRLAAIGWKPSVDPVRWRFFYATASRPRPG